MEVAKTALDLRAQGKTIKDIANILKIGDATVYRYLKIASITS